jgi:hypothetical protein
VLQLRPGEAQSLHLTLTGAVDVRYEIQTSDDLASWTTRQTVTNVTGIVVMEDVVVEDTTATFFRAVELIESAL